jgi:hypothetical protein
MTVPGNPYVGPRAFEREERLYGREEEGVALTDLLISERIVLLYSPSGAGKSSLVEAGVATRLHGDGFHVLPTLRVCDRPVDRVPDGANPYLLCMLLKLDEHLNPEAPTPLEKLARVPLKDYLTSLEEKLSGGNTSGFFDVLLIDQFEEILTQGVHSRQTEDWRRQFFVELGDALKNPRRFALFSMREDFIAGLDPYLNLIPTQLTNTYRLELLTRDKAIQAIAEPARAVGVTFEAEALDHLVKDLSRSCIQGPTGTEEHRGIFVEPVQLQIVCRRLWDKLAETGALKDRRIEDPEVARVVGEVDEALASYYEEHVREAARASGVDERAIRDWIAHELIGSSGIRNQVQQGPVSAGGDSLLAVTVLQNAFLVRSERRYGADWFELAHDRLIRPIQRNNSSWSQTHLRPLQRRSGHWAKDLDDRLLLRGPELADEVAWAKLNDARLTEDDRKFLAASQRAADVARRRRWRDAVVVAALVAAVLILGFQGYQERDRIAAQALSSTREWAKQVATVVDDRLRFAKTFIEVEAQQEALKRMLRDPSSDERKADLQAYMEELRGRAEHFGFIHTVLVTDRHALVLAGAPKKTLEGVIGSSYPYREWFNGERDVLGEKDKAREPRQEAGFSLAYKSTQKDGPMLIALATPVRTEEPGGDVLGVLQGTIDLAMFNKWLLDVENMDGECPIRFSLLLNRDQLIRHPCPVGAPLPEDGYGTDPSVANLLRSGSASDFRDPLGSGVAYFAATSSFVRSDQWRALVLYNQERALPTLWLTIFPVLLLAGVTTWVGYLLLREH